MTSSYERIITGAKVEIDQEQILPLIEKVANDRIEQLLSERLAELKQVREIPLHKAEAARKANVCPQTISNWETKGWIKGHRVGGKIYYYLSEIFKAKESSGQYWSNEPLKLRR